MLRLEAMLHVELPVLHSSVQGIAGSPAIEGQGSTQSEVRLSHLLLPLGQLGHRRHGGLQSVPDRVRLHLLSFTVIIDYGWDHYFTEASAYLGI